VSVLQKRIPFAGVRLGILFSLIKEIVELMSLFGDERVKDGGKEGAWWRSAKTDFVGPIGLYLGVEETKGSGIKIESPSMVWVVMIFWASGRPAG
jgi:hypothetical protein